MEKGDWKKHVQLKDKKDYISPTQFVDASMLSAAPAASTPQAKVAFNDPANMKAFMEKRVQAVQLT